MVFKVTQPYVLFGNLGITYTRIQYYFNDFYNEEIFFFLVFLCHNIIIGLGRSLTSSMFCIYRVKNDEYFFFIITCLEDNLCINHCVQ